MIDQVRAYLLGLQADICTQLEAVDGKAKFIKDKWEKPNNAGDGLTCVLTNGDAFEQAGVNFSIVRGDNMPASATALRPELAGRSFTALGVSLVIHPNNPYAPVSIFSIISPSRITGIGHNNFLTSKLFFILLLTIVL